MNKQQTKYFQPEELSGLNFCFNCKKFKESKSWFTDLYQKLVRKHKAIFCIECFNEREEYYQKKEERGENITEKIKTKIITRHEKELKNRTNLTTYTAFMAPRIHQDAIQMLKWYLSKKDHKFDYHIFPMSIKRFVEWFVITSNNFKLKVEKKFFEFKDNKAEDLDQIVN